MQTIIYSVQSELEVTDPRTPQVSVVIPAYNRARYLGTAIQSILAQTFSDYEIIVVDDGSIDETPTIAQGYGDPVHYIRQENRGLSAARNTGIRHARTNIIALLDADDFWEPEFLKEMVPVLDRHWEAAAVYCGYRYINEYGHIIGKPNRKIVAPEAFYRTLICEGNWLVPCAVVFRKQLAEEVGLFDESLRAVEDADLWAKLSYRNLFIGIPQALVRYRRHEGNMTKDPERMMSASLLQTEKMFGPPNHDVQSWTPLKRCAYVQHFRMGIYRYLARGDVDTSAFYFQQLAEISPTTGLSMGMWRYVARIHIPEECRNDSPDTFDWTAAQRDVTALLREIAKRTAVSAVLSNRYRMIEGSAFLALADEAGRSVGLRQALLWLWRTALQCPQLLFSRPYWGTLVRSLAHLLGAREQTWR